MRLCHLDELPDGGSRGFAPRGDGRDTVFVVRVGQQVQGYRDECPHWPGTPLPWRRHAYLSGDGRHIRCSAHGALFDIASGECVLGPCLGESLAPVALSVHGDGAVHLTQPTPMETTR